MNPFAGPIPSAVSRARARRPMNNLTIFNFLTKPCNGVELVGAVRDGFAAFESALAPPRTAGRP